MLKACPLSEFAPGEAFGSTKLHQSPSSIQKRARFSLSTTRFTNPGSTCGPEAWTTGRPNCRSHEIHIIDGNIMAIPSDEAPNLPPGMTAEGHV